MATRSLESPHVRRFFDDMQAHAELFVADSQSHLRRHVCLASRAYAEYTRLGNTIDQLAALAREDSELRSMADDDSRKARECRETLALQIMAHISHASASLSSSSALVACPALRGGAKPRAPPLDDEHGSLVLEIRPGAGGAEASLFAAQLFDMYGRYARRRNWGWEDTALVAAPEISGGVREAIATLRGPSRSLEQLVRESGVHRVQRVPETESSGRIHTSTVTVAVLPLRQSGSGPAAIPSSEVRVDVYRAGGAGGQNVNKVETAVRMTHLPTGLVVCMQDERSQAGNRERAMRVLQARLQDLRRREEESTIQSTRRAQTGLGDRSEKIRTYNFPQGRVTDHRVGLSLHCLGQVLAGERLHDFVEALHFADLVEKLDGLRESIDGTGESQQQQQG